MRTNRRWARSVVGLCAVLATLSGCSSAVEPRPARTGSGAAPSLSASITQYTSDVLPRRLQVQVHQGAGPAVTMRAVVVRVPGFAGTVRQELDDLTRPNGTIDLPIPLGRAECPAVARSPVQVELRTTAGVLRLTAIDPDGLVRRLHAEECAVRQVLAQVPLRWSRTWTRHGTASRAVVAGHLIVGPVAAGHRAAVTGLDGTVLFEPSAPPLREPLRLAAGRRAAIPVTLAPARCDPHAVAEAKAGYAFPVRVSLDGAASVRVRVQPEAAAQTDMHDMLIEHCGLH